VKSGWTTKKLSDVCELINRGIAPKYIDEGGIQVLNQKCIRDHSVNYELARRNNPELKSVPEERLIRVGDVLVNSTGTGTLGRVAQVREMPNEPTTVDTHVTIVRPKEGMFYLDFFGYALIEIEEEIKNSGAGASGQTELARDVLKNEFTISFPESLKEQQRIVDILDEAFAGIATATAIAEKNLQNARELFDSTLQSVFAEKGEGWVEQNKPLKELCELIVDCEHKTAPTQEEGFPSIRTPNIGKGKLLLDGVYRVSEETYREWTRRAEPQPGDLIFAREAPAGNVAVIPENLKVCLGQRTVLIRPKLNIFHPEFLAWLLLQPKMQQKLLEHSRGATVQHVNMKDIRALDVGAIPPLPVQEEIVSVINKAHDETQLLEKVYQHKFDMLTELKQSILQKAFAGELH
jgi:type I restriction enzyme S subunit